MTRFGHGHSLGLGALLALSLAHGHILWLLTAAFAGGLLVGRGWWALGRLMRDVAGRLQLQRRAFYRPRPW